ncbi:VWA domain-containing protein [Pontiella sulfatireligans]|uniref:VWFA domain-containing protein n=1 Tax=Pontiella sulfatireligans TaxID=2750658 RepID=A0A6C2USB7_9BACT|nr:vWA domain-containing protein [Pontiella sulfatireligans]VGO23205.1 hypothetical protein SCARR_05312 [Pontiella sulfatireligans]
MTRSFHNFATAAQKLARKVCTIILIDVSPSMEAPDYPPSRLMAAIAAIIDLLGIKLERHPDDYVGIVKFSGSASIVQSPLPVGSQFEVLKHAALNGLTVGGYTNIAAGLKCAAEALSHHCPVPDRKGGAIKEFFLGLDRGTAPSDASELKCGIQGHVILLTDGDHNCPGFPRDWGKRLKDAGVVIDCIGIGGSPSQVNECLLRDIASVDESGRPRYRFIDDRDALLMEFHEMAKAGYLRKA